MVRKILIAACALALGLTMAPAEPWAVGGISSGTTTSKADSDLEAAQEAVDAGDYRTAIDYLDKAVRADPKSADAYNLLGYSHRKLGDVETALAHYRKALDLNRNHLGANEYIGELYLELGEVAKAEEHLDRLGKVCAYACPEYKELEQAMKAYKSTAGG